ncbi:MAG: hypothetical protein GC159_02205 [Phycisphaera sp.]|nr:hypothetical protein [Phycisphaera sp.]
MSDDDQEQPDAAHDESPDEVLDRLSTPPRGLQAMAGFFLFWALQAAAYGVATWVAHDEGLFVAVLAAYGISSVVSLTIGGVLIGTRGWNRVNGGVIMGLMISVGLAALGACFLFVAGVNAVCGFH